MGAFLARSAKNQAFRGFAIAPAPAVRPGRASRPLQSLARRAAILHSKIAAHAAKSLFNILKSPWAGKGLVAFLRNAARPCSLPQMRPNSEL
jgi:hypothetical protein